MAVEKERIVCLSSRIALNDVKIIGSASDGSILVALVAQLLIDVISPTQISMGLKYPFSSFPLFKSVLAEDIEPGKYELLEVVVPVVIQEPPILIPEMKLGEDDVPV